MYRCIKMRCLKWKNISHFSRVIQLTLLVCLGCTYFLYTAETDNFWNYTVDTSMCKPSSNVVKIGEIDTVKNVKEIDTTADIENVDIQNIEGVNSIDTISKKKHAKPPQKIEKIEKRIPHIIGISFQPYKSIFYETTVCLARNEATSHFILNEPKMDRWEERVAVTIANCSPDILIISGYKDGWISIVKYLVKEYPNIKIIQVWHGVTGLSVNSGDAISGIGDDVKIPVLEEWITLLRRGKIWLGFINMHEELLYNNKAMGYHSTVRDNMKHRFIYFPIIDVAVKNYSVAKIDLGAGFHIGVFDSDHSKIRIILAASMVSNAVIHVVDASEIYKNLLKMLHVKIINHASTVDRRTLYASMHINFVTSERPFSVYYRESWLLGVPVITGSSVTLPPELAFTSVPNLANPIAIRDKIMEVYKHPQVDYVREILVREAAYNAKIVSDQLKIINECY